MEKCEHKFKAIFETGKNIDLLQLMDGTIVTDDRCSFDIHKVILARSSDFFRALFCGIDKGKKIYRISNITGECLSDILIYIYNENISVTEGNIKDLLIASDYLSMKKLYYIVKSNVRKLITHENCLGLVNAFYQLNDDEMLQFCLNICTLRFQQIMRSHQKYDLRDFSLELMDCILRNPNLNVRCERSVFLAIVYWVEANLECNKEHVENLLSTLALREIDENLATEILNHNIVSHNIHLSFLNSDKNFGSNYDHLVNFLLKDSNNKPQDFRKPKKLHIFTKFVHDQRKIEIYVSYDETLDFWRKLSVKRGSFLPIDLITFKWNIYISDRFGETCESLNLKTMEWKQLENIFDFENENFLRLLFAVDNSIYILVNENQEYHLMVYDTELRRRQRIVSLDTSYRFVSAIAIGKIIFIVAISRDFNQHIVKTFDPFTQQWACLAVPNAVHYEYQLVVCQNKVCLIDRFNENVKPRVEVYDPKINDWKVLPNITEKNTFCSDAIALNDELVIDDCEVGQRGELIDSKIARWNLKEQCWEKLQKPKPEDIHFYNSCQVFDCDVIRYLTKQTRASQFEMTISDLSDPTFL